MKIFLDANVLISVVNKEYPVFVYSSRVLSLADNPKFQLYTSPICLAITFYFAEKKSGPEMAKKKIEILVGKIKVATVDHSAVINTIKNKAVSDLEDGLEYYAAKNVKCQRIITEDKNDFFFSEIEVLNSQTFLETYGMPRKR
jgi:predicted nucleic acid-binding protein